MNIISALLCGGVKAPAGSSSFDWQIKKGFSRAEVCVRGGGDFIWVCVVMWMTSSFELPAE